MNWPYAYSPQIWPLFSAVFLFLALAIYSWRRRSVPGAVPFMIGCLFAAGYAFGTLMETAAVGLSTKIFWFKFQAPLQLPIVTAITCFILDYAWPGRWLTRRNLILLSIPCLLIAGLTLTNDLHHLNWRGFVYEGKVIPLRGLANLIGLAYAFIGLEALNLIAFGWLFMRSPQHRWAVVIMLVGQLVGRTVYTLEAARRFQYILHFDMLGMAFEFLMYAIALFGFRILDPIPLARRTVIQQLQTGMLVLDPQGMIVSLNPAAQAILGRSEKQAVNHSIQELLPDCAGLIGDLQSAGKVQTEISLPEGHRDAVGAGADARYYQVEVSPLKDWRGVEIGRLLLLQDVTEQKRAQAQIFEQQQVVATLQERERLAHELHDNLGQVFGYVSMQAQAIRKQARDGDLSAIEPQLTRLAEVAQETHREIRESIFGLRSSPAEQWFFFTALRQHLDACQEHYGLRTELAIPSGLSEDVISPGAGVQLLRVIQEAVTNARKHGHAGCVQVSFRTEDRQVLVTVSDDGCGFDLAQLESQEEGHYGLVFMHERMAQIGGSVSISTQPGSGTQVALRAPVRDDPLVPRSSR